MNKKKLAGRPEKRFKINTSFDKVIGILATNKDIDLQNKKNIKKNIKKNLIK